MSTTSWATAASGNWNTAGNWTNGVPSGTTGALITINGTYTVTSSAFNVVSTLDMQKKATLDIASNIFDIIAQTATNVLAGTITMADGAQIQIGSSVPGGSTTFNNTGSINIGTGVNSDELLIDNQVTLEGKGKLNLLGDSSAISNGDDGVLTNESTIVGAGLIGDPSDPAFTIDNGAKGIIDANNPVFQLRIVPGSDWTNSGIMEATNGGTMALEADVVLTQNGKGQLKATSGSTIFITDDFELSGGTVSIAHGATLASTGVLGGQIQATVKNAGTVSAEAGLLDIGDVKNSGSGVVVAGAFGPGSGFLLQDVTGGKLEIESSASGEIYAGNTKVIFEAGSTGTLTLDGDGANRFTGTISGMSADPGASIILENIGYADNPTLSYAHGVLTVTDTSPFNSVVDKIKILNGGTFTTQASSGGFLQIFDPPAPTASAPGNSTQLLTQAIASFNAGSGVAAAPTANAPSNNPSSDFLAATSLPHHG